MRRSSVEGVPADWEFRQAIPTADTHTVSFRAQRSVERCAADPEPRWAEAGDKERVPVSAVHRSALHRARDDDVCVSTLDTRAEAA